MSYADDLVIMANSHNDLAKALLTLSATVKKLKLKINFKKSKIMTAGPGTMIPHKWTFTESDSKTNGTMEEVKNYKYLGVTVGIPRYIEHLQLKSKLFKYLEVQSKSIAHQSLFITHTVNALL